MLFECRLLRDYPGYRVGNDGTVWSCWQRKAMGFCCGFKSFMGDTWKQLRTHRHKRSGHLGVTVRRKDGKFVRRWVHHLVLEAFVGPRPEGMEACHFPDRNPENNSLDNLRWDTREANREDSRQHGTLLTGSKNPRAKLTPYDVIAIFRDKKAGMTISALARRHKVSRRCIGMVLKGDSYKSL